MVISKEIGGVIERIELGVKGRTGTRANKYVTAGAKQAAYSEYRTTTFQVNMLSLFESRGRHMHNADDVGNGCI